MKILYFTVTALLFTVTALLLSFSNASAESRLHKFQIAKVKGVPQVKVEGDWGNWGPQVTVRKRTATSKLILEVRAPQAAEKIIKRCGEQAGAAAVLTLLATPAASIATAKATFGACMISKLGKVSFKIRHEQDSGSWK